MRFLLYVAAVVVLSAVAPLRECRAAEGWAPGEYLTQALDQMLIAHGLIPDHAGVGFDDDSGCLAGVYLRREASYSLTRRFEKGIEYFLLAGGDQDAEDVDIEILDESGRRVVSDNSPARMAAVSFTPAESARYTVRLRLFECRRNAFCAFAILRRGSAGVLLSNLATARAKFLVMAVALEAQARIHGLHSWFLSEPDQVAVFGCVLSDGQSLDVSNVRLGTSPAVIVAAGDVRATDLDLFLLDRNGIVEEDIARQAEAVIFHQPLPGENYQVRVVNRSGNGRDSFVLIGLLHVTQ